LAAFVAESEARCPACGYSLAGLAGEQCPECGVGLRLTLAKRGRSWAWVYGLIGLSIGAGLLTLALAMLVLMLVTAEWYQYTEAAVFGAILLGAVAGQSLALSRWIVRREGVGVGRAVLAWVFTAGLGGAVWLAAAVMAVL